MIGEISLDPEVATITYVSATGNHRQFAQVDLGLSTLRSWPIKPVAPMNPPDYKFGWELDDGSSVTIRAIRPDDASIEQDFVRSLSPRSRTQRFFSPIKELSASALKKFTHTDFPNEMALVATVDQKGSEHEIGVARYAPSPGSGQVEFAVVVADGWQGKGIATELLRHLFSIASEVGINSIEGFILRDNVPMLKLAREFGFRISPDKEDPGIAYAFKDIQMQAGED